MRPSRAIAAGAVAVLAMLLCHHRGQAFFVGKPAAGLLGRTDCLRKQAQAQRSAGVVRSRLTATMTPEKTEETVSVLNDDGTRKTGEQIREEFFMAAMTGQERGLPPGSYLNDTVEEGPDVAQVSVVWQPFEDKVSAPAGSNLLRSALGCGAMELDNTFCLTGQCEACMAEVDGKVVLSCMVPVPDDGRTDVEALVCNSDAAWDDMMVWSSSSSGGSAKPLLKPMRSVLYTPGSSRHLYKIREIACDASLIDLEDGVAPEAKDNARERVCSEVAKGGYGRKAVVVRINSLDSPWGEDDIREVAKLTLDAVVIPKVESAADVKRVADLLRQHGAKDTDLWCMIETPLGVTRANEIASAHETVSCLVLGTSDLTRDLQANHTPDRTPLLYSLSRCILAARTYGLRCLDGVHLDMTDAEGFERACRQGRDMGMDGKTLIHPSTVAVANWFFGPNASEVEQAYRVVEAHEEAAAKGEGCAVLDGSLVERLHAENARRVIELHESIAALEAGQETGA
eukprot:g4054.t1